MPYAVEGSSHLSCFLLSERLGHGAERRSDKQKPRQQRLAVGDKVKDSAVPPRLTRHRCRVHSSTANTVRLLTRALRPRLLVTFRLGPPGPILSGSVPAGITPSPTLSQSVSRFLPVNGLLSCFYAITAFSPCQRIFAAFLKFSARSSPTARRARTRAHTCSCAHRIIVVPHRPTNFPPCASLKCRALPHKLLFRARQHALSASAVRKRHAFNKRESGWRRKHMRKTTGGSA